MKIMNGFLKRINPNLWERILTAFLGFKQCLKEKIINENSKEFCIRRKGHFGKCSTFIGEEF